MSIPQEASKVKTPLHLRLTADDWEECYQSLNHGELGVFIWIRASDPYGDRELEINCVQLGKKLGLHKSTISRALQSLSQKGFIELELINTKVKQKISNRRLTLLCKEENESNNELEGVKESVAPAQPQLHQRNHSCTSATTVAPAQPQLHQRNDQPPKRSTSKGFAPLHTLTDSFRHIQTTTNNAAAVAAAENSVSEKPQEKAASEQVSEEDLEKAVAEVRRLTPDIEINTQVKQCLSQHLANLPAALAHVKKAIAEGWKCSNITGLFIKALKNPPEAPKTAANGISFKEWFDEAKGRGLADYSMGVEGDILIVFRNGTEALFSAIRSMTWEELEKAYGNNR